MASRAYVFSLGRLPRTHMKKHQDFSHRKVLIFPPNQVPSSLNLEIFNIDKTCLDFQADVVCAETIPGSPLTHKLDRVKCLQRRKVPKTHLKKEWDCEKHTAMVPEEET